MGNGIVNKDVIEVAGDQLAFDRKLGNNRNGQKEFNEADYLDSEGRPRKRYIKEESDEITQCKFDKVE